MRILAPPYELSELSCRGPITALLCGSKKHPRFTVDEDGRRIVEILTPKLTQRERTASVRAAMRHATFRNLLLLNDWEYGFIVTFDEEDETKDCMVELASVLHEMAHAINRLNMCAPNSALTNPATRSGRSEGDLIVTTWLKGHGMGPR